MSVVSSREDLDETTSYLNCADNSILGMEDCGCGLAVVGRSIERFKSGKNSGLIITFRHEERRCIAAVQNWDGYYVPFTLAQYRAAGGIDDEVDEEL